MSIIKSIERSNKKAKEREWTKQYYFFSVHNTILYSDYSGKKRSKFYPYAKEVLQYLNKRDDIVLGIYSSSYHSEIEKFITFFKKNEIDFKLVNHNPEVDNKPYGYYEEKPYYNVLFEHKAGFDAEEDWKELAIHFDILNNKN